MPASDIYSIPGFDQPFSSLSHLVGAGAFAVLGVLLLRRGRGDWRRLAYLSVYAASCVVLLSISGVYHLVDRGGTAHLVMERLDHAAIFVLIAGTFTPPHGILFSGVGRWGPLVLIWTAAIVGITLKTIYFDSIPEMWGLSLYLAMGWVGAIGAVVAWRRYGADLVKPLFAGAVAYTIGAVVHVSPLPSAIPGVVARHELWHVAVLLAMTFHWTFIYRFADGRIGPDAVR